MGYPVKVDNEEYEPESPELLLDLAAGELKRQGFVEITELEEKLSDGEQDYLIKLTDAGAKKLADGEKPVFRHLDL